MGFFSSKSTTYDPMSAYTPQQRDSIQALMSLASTGSGGGITLGDAYNGNLGYYQQTPGELQSLAGLQGLIGGQEISGARDVYSRMANNTFNPDDPSSGYAAFSRALAKSGKESSDILNREAAMTGSRMGTGIQRAKGDLASDLQNQRGSYLAQLFNQGENRAMQGAQGLQSLAGTQADLYNQLASQAAIERLLKDKQAKDQYQDFERQQRENMTRLDLMQNQLNNPMGSITTKSPSMFSQLAGKVMNSAAEGLGAGIGGMLTGGIGNLFSGATKGLPGWSVRNGTGGGMQNLSSFGGGTAPYKMPSFL